MASVSKYISNLKIHASPTIHFTGTLTVSRNPSTSTTVSVSLSGNLNLYSGSSYGTPYSGFGLGFTLNQTGHNDWHGNYYNLSSGGSDSVSESWSNIEFTSGSLTIYINCDFGSYSNPTRHCDKGWSNTAIATIDYNEIPRDNPFSPPSATLSFNPKDIYINKSTHTASYTITKGTGNITSAELYLVGGNSYPPFALSTSQGSHTLNNIVFNISVPDADIGVSGKYSMSILLKTDDSLQNWWFGNEGVVLRILNPSITIIGHKDLGVYNKTDDYNITYDLTEGSRPFYRTGIQIFDENGSSLQTIYFNDTTEGRKYHTYTLNSSNCTHGKHYRIQAFVFDSSQNYMGSNIYDIHTCHYPSVNNLNLYDGSTVITSFSPQNTSVQFKWTQDNNNNNLWTGEAAQTNMLYTETGSSQHALYPGNNDTSLTLTQANANVLFPVSERNASSISKNVALSRYHSQIPVSVYSYKTVTLQLQPTKTPSGFKIYNSAGTTDITTTVQNKRISKTTYQQVVLKWTYPINEIASGVVDGYKIELYEDQNCTTLIKNLGLTAHSDYSNERYTLNVKQDCKSLVLNYIKITPYYKYDNNNIYYGTNTLIQPLFIPYGELDTPTIDYPINNTTWHNEKFRVLFQLPTDDDYDSSQSSTYRYRDIEINIEYTVNNTTSTKTYTYINNPTIFSTSTLSYQKKIVINPSLLNTLPVADKYKIKIKVGKTVSNETIWSSYSSIVTLNRQDLAPLESGGEDYQTIYEELNEILNESDNYTNPGDTNINIYNELNTILDESDPYTGSGTGTIVVGRNNKSITL